MNIGVLFVFGKWNLKAAHWATFQRAGKAALQIPVKTGFPERAMVAFHGRIDLRGQRKSREANRGSTSCGQLGDIYGKPNGGKGPHTILKVCGDVKNCTFKAMGEKIIADIVKKAFEKAQGEHAKHTVSALARHISDQTHLSDKTLVRFHKKYIQNNGSQKKPNAASIEVLCRYLGYGDYGEYRRANPLEDGPKGTRGEVPPDPAHTRAKMAKYRPYVLGLLIGTGVLAAINTLWTKEAEPGCMAWADTLYVKVGCDLAPYSPYGTEVVPLDEMKLKNFKKVKVNMATEFFSEQTGKPLIWYIKNAGDEVEFYTAPGLHPITGKTLNEISEHIIQKYVPIHDLDPDSFLGTN